MTELKIGGIYRHYKNKPYRVLSLARHSETMEELVIYECLYPNDLGQIWARPKAMFLGEVEIKGEQVPRFKFEQEPSR